MKKQLKKIKAKLSVASAMLMPVSAFAGTFGDGDDGQNMILTLIQNFTAFLQGDIARACCTLIFVICGYYTFIDPKMGKKKGITGMVGMAILFSAGFLNKTFFGTQ